jgi:hypothetical protein
MGSSELTDGFWRWPEGLSHYVRHHGIILPEEFMAQALAHGPLRVSEELTSPTFLGIASTLHYWRGWCAAHRSPSFLDPLRQLRAEADARALVVERDEIQLRVLKEIDRYGLGDERCIFSGCKERVLSGMKLCARHVQRDTDHLADGCYTITAGVMAELGAAAQPSVLLDPNGPSLH